MVRREAFINKIRRDLGYSYKNQQLRTQLWKKKGTTERMFVPLADLLARRGLRDGRVAPGWRPRRGNQVISRCGQKIGNRVSRLQSY
jgi:hypothetical protein